MDNMCFIHLITENCVICKTFNTCIIRLMIENLCYTVYYIIICRCVFFYKLKEKLLFTLLKNYNR